MRVLRASECPIGAECGQKGAHRAEKRAEEGEGRKTDYWAPEKAQKSASARIARAFVSRGGGRADELALLGLQAPSGGHGGKLVLYTQTSQKFKKSKKGFWFAYLTYTQSLQGVCLDLENNASIDRL